MNNDQVKETKQIKKEVLSKIKQGEPKQQILEELSKKYKDKITIVKQLETSPSLAMKQKYSLHNYLLAAMLLAALVIDVILVFRTEIQYWLNYTTYLNVFLDLVLLIGVLLYRIENYSWAAARAVVSILYIIILNAYYHLPIHTLTLISLGLVVLSFVLGLFLSVRLSPPRVPKVIEVAIDGTEKINKTIYVFPD